MPTSTLEVIPNTIKDKLSNGDWHRVAFVTGESVEYAVYRNYLVTEAHCFYLLAEPTSGSYEGLQRWASREQTMKVFLGTDFDEVYRAAVQDALRTALADFA